MQIKRYKQIPNCDSCVDRLIGVYVAQYDKEEMMPIKDIHFNLPGWCYDEENIVYAKKNLEKHKKNVEESNK